MSDTEDLAALNDRLMAKNHALAEALSRAGKELTKAKSQLAQLAQPPLTFATMVKVDSTRTDEDGIQHASAEVISGTRRMVVPVASNVNAARLTAGATVMLNEKLVLVEQRDADTVGQIRSVKQVLDDGRLIVTDASGNPVLIRRSGALAYAGINQGDRIIVDPSVRLAIEALPAEGDKDLVLEETPDVTFADIGGLDSEIGRIRDAVQLPFQHRALFERYDLKPPKGVLLYGPPGNGKTMIAKAVANALCEGGDDTNGDGSISPAETRVKGVFLSVKGPELLNVDPPQGDNQSIQVFIHQMGGLFWVMLPDRFIEVGVEEGGPGQRIIHHREVEIGGVLGHHQTKQMGDDRIACDFGDFIVKVEVFLFGRFPERMGLVMTDQNLLKLPQILVGGPLSCQLGCFDLELDSCFQNIQIDLLIGGGGEIQQQIYIFF